ncbi:MAG: hypothetical protein WBP93_23175 [Pyrinomonadaceae bacterium]
MSKEQFPLVGPKSAPYSTGLHAINLRSNSGNYLVIAGEILFPHA